MPDRFETQSRKLLGRLRDIMASGDAGQARLDEIVRLIASSMRAEVCSIYLFRDVETLELCATEGLEQDAVHQTRMRLGEGLVGRVARTKRVVNTGDAPSSKGFRYMPETGEERYSSFCGIPVQRLGETMGVLVVQSLESREFTFPVAAPSRYNHRFDLIERQRFHLVVESAERGNPGLCKQIASGREELAKLYPDRADIAQ